MAETSKNPYIAALQWHVDVGADEVWQDSPNNRVVSARDIVKSVTADVPADAPKGGMLAAAAGLVSATDLLGTAQAQVEAARLAANCSTLEELRAAMEEFEGLAIKKTATQMVFSDGNPNARVMVVGEAPGADEDRMGLPFVGASGQLLDKIFAAIGLARNAEDLEKAVYISNVINWRPPGNRTPSPAEIDVSMPFIERHIALVKPKVLILCGGISAKALLASGESISKLRGRFHDYRPLTDGIANDLSVIPAIATYHPAYLLRTPLQKKSVWADMLMLREFLEQN